MGCAASRIDKEERVQICKERKRLMKQLLGFRGEFADSVLSYLRAFKNTGVTLRQFSESESTLELENVPFTMVLPPSSPPPLPPSPPLPPPPPPFSPDLRKFEGSLNVEAAQEEIVVIDEESNGTPPPPLIPSSSWDFWDPFENASPQHDKHSELMEQIEDENWAETRTEFEEDDKQEEVTPEKTASALPKDVQNIDVVDNNSSIMSGQAKNTRDMTMVVPRSKKTLPGIIKELDDYFLKASSAGKEVAVLADADMRNISFHHDSKESKRKGNNSAKVFSSLSWSWSSRSLLSTKDAAEFGSLDEPCRPGAHCITLEKLYALEQRLYKAVKEEEITKLEHEKKSSTLQKQEDEKIDWNRIERTRLAVENLQSDLLRLRELISRNSSSILQLIDEELHPQLIAFLSGLLYMWRTMYECHQIQHHISQQLNNLSNHPSTDPTTEYHREATLQLESEVNFWYNSFCRLAKTEREYVSALCRWIQLTDGLMDSVQQNGCSKAVRTVCDEWQLALDRVSEKVAAEAIKRFLMVIHSMILQQEEECNLKKKADKLEKRLEKEVNSLKEMESKLLVEVEAEAASLDFSPKHPINVKRAKTDALEKRYENEKAKYLRAAEVSRAMTLNSLRTCLPDVFQALTGYAGARAQAFEALFSLSHDRRSH
ncbi:hypothetical protein Ancab_019080 [Ancistrocladus abbreviatus]